MYCGLKTFCRSFRTFFVPGTSLRVFHPRNNTYFKKIYQIHTFIKNIYFFPLYFIVGYRTTRAAILSMIHILAKRPDLQRELQKEMDTVIGSEREPRLSDRGDCPRIESFILETLRYISHLPLFVFHAASQPTSIGGYDVEKDTVVFEFITLSKTPMWPNGTFVRGSRLSGLILIRFKSL